jgi:hypothetical protein
MRLARVCVQLLKETKPAFQHLLKHTFLITVATVTAVETQPMCGVWRVAENLLKKGLDDLSWV